MKLRDKSVGPPGNWTYRCPICSNKTFAGATFDALVGAVTRHAIEAGHPFDSVKDDIETEICRRIGAQNYVTHTNEKGGNTILLLGRYGDIVNLMPLAFGLSLRGSPVDWIVGKEFSGILEGASYIRPLKFEGGPDDLQEAARVTRDQNPRIAQCWKNPDQRRLTPSFTTESWRLAGAQDDFGKWPLIFDQRDRERERLLLSDAKASIQSTRPIILVATESISSPFANGELLIDTLHTNFPGAVLDMSTVHADKPQDLLVLIEAADVLVTVDTLHLHLARACNTPVIALLNQGWLASTPPPQTIYSHPYYHPVSAIVEEVKQIILHDPSSYVVATSNPHGTDERYRRALRTHPCRFIPSIPVRSARDIGDSRDLLYIKDVLHAALIETKAEVVIYTNADVTFNDQTIPSIMEHARRFNFGCCRRDAGHVGREIFWFTRQWLHRYLKDMPDVIWGAPKPDLILCKWLRAIRGIPTTVENLMYDFPPVELPAGLIYHEPHRSGWLSHQWSASAQHNEKIWSML